MIRHKIRLHFKTIPGQTVSFILKDSMIRLLTTTEDGTLQITERKILGA
ncbi:MAG TPA: hypothetical protein VGO09_02080 [Flavisolibacter sp.]|nr:hypothetical protein [Flavisolibacter sp.]